MGDTGFKLKIILNSHPLGQRQKIYLEINRRYCMRYIDVKVGHRLLKYEAVYQPKRMSTMHIFWYKNYYIGFEVFNEDGQVHMKQIIKHCKRQITKGFDNVCNDR